MGVVDRYLSKQRLAMLSKMSSNVKQKEKNDTIKQEG